MRYFFTAVSAGRLNNFNYVFLSKCKLEVNFLSLFNVNRFILLFKDGFCSQGSQLSCPFMGSPLITLVHVEASVYKSIVLAGILLKLGGIGMLRFSKFLHASHLWTEFGGKVIRDGASGRFKENRCLLFCFSYRIFRLTYLFSNKTHGEDFRS